MVDCGSISGGSGTKFAGSGTQSDPFCNFIEVNQERKVTASVNIPVAFEGCWLTLGLAHQ
jgi:hypothetical protein